MKTTYIFNKEKIAAQLVFKDDIPVYLSHPKADHYVENYQFKIGGEIIGDFYLNQYIQLNHYIFLTKQRVDLIDNQARVNATELHQINLKSGKVKVISKLEGGVITPEKIENNLIIYQKRKNGSSAIHLIEQEIKGI